MNTLRKFILSFAVLMQGHAVAAQAHEGEWISYRDAYRLMSVFENYDQEKNLLQHRLHIRIRDKDEAIKCTQLTISTAAAQQVLPLDSTGRAPFPMLKSAYDENTRLVMDCNTRHFAFNASVSIAPRADGVYSRADLSAACEQALRYHRYHTPSSRARRCTGVRFLFPPERKDTGHPQLVEVNFHASDASMPLVAPTTPLSIVALFE
jgi:hypothetical protein